MFVCLVRDVGVRIDADNGMFSLVQCGAVRCIQRVEGLGWRTTVSIFNIEYIAKRHDVTLALFLTTCCSACPGFCNVLRGVW